MPRSIPNWDYLRQKDAKLYELVRSVFDSIPQLELPAPPPVTAFTVTSNNGRYEATLADSGPVKKGVSYFIEFDTDPNFPTPHVRNLGTGRGWSEVLGAGTFYFRAYSQYQPPFNSPPSPYIFFGGSTPSPVVGGGATAPITLPSTGSGTTAVNGQQGSQGFGIDQIRKVDFPEFIT